MRDREGGGEARDRSDDDDMFHSPHRNTGDEVFFQAHAENLSALLECERETKKETKHELLDKLRTENLRWINQDKWMYNNPKTREGAP